MYSQQIAQTGEANTGKQKRLYYLDWLRVLAVLGVFYAHTVSIFDILYWHVNNSRTMTLVVFGTQWGMSLFFLLAGASAWFSLDSRTGRQFISERFARLVIPFVVGIMLLSPPVGYLLGQPSYHGSFLQYYVYFFGHVQLSLSPQVLAAYGFHLWFLAFLFLFSVLAIVPFLYLKHVQGQRITAWLAVICERRGGLFLGILPLALIQVTLRAAFPGYQGWADFLSWFVYFVYGYLLLANARMTRAVQKQGRSAFLIGVACLIILLATMYGPGFLAIWGQTPSYSVQYELYQLLYSVTAWSWMIFVLYFGMRFLNFGNKLIHYANEAILPFYVLHYCVIVTIAFLFMQWHADMVAKFLVVSTLSLAGTLIVYEVLIRRVRLSRWLFGMKPD